MSHRITVPLFITCQRPECGKVVPVINRYRQRVQRFCCNSCGALNRKNSPMLKVSQRRGGLVCGQRRRLAVLERIKGLSALEAFRVGYDRGLHSKHRQLRRFKRSVAA